MKKLMEKYGLTVVTILILIDGFLQFRKRILHRPICRVTILILIDGFLQFEYIKNNSYISLKSQSLF